MASGGRLASLYQGSPAASEEELPFNRFSGGPGSLNRKSTLAGLSMTLRDRKSLTGPIDMVRSNERKTMLIGR